MSVKTIMFAGNRGSGQTEDSWSRGIWHNCPIDAIREGSIPGVIFEDDFTIMPKTPATTEGNFGRWTQFSSTGGTVDPAATGRGWALGSDGDDEGASIRTRTAPFKISRDNFRLWCEFQVKHSTIADTKHGCFFGLGADTAFSATVPLTAAGAIADFNCVGFLRPEGDGDGVDTVYKADGVTAVTVQADAIVPVADTFYKAGMVFEPNPDREIQDPNLAGTKYNLFFYKDGIRLSSYKQIPSAAGTDFPNDVQLGLFFAVLNATATTPGTSTIGRVRCVQVYEPHRGG